jgi:ADP-heptose:LPS heptosyltransferase
MPRRILFAIRSKLGDTLISYAAVRAYVDAHPHDQVTLLTRADYAQLLAREPGLRVIGFGSRATMILKLWWLRLAEPGFDVLGVLWGSGAPIAAIGRWAKAARKIAWNRKFAPAIYEQGSLPDDYPLVAPAMSVIHAFEPGLAAPRGMALPSLTQDYAHAQSRRAGECIGVVPVADELRRNLDAPTLLLLLAEVRRRHPRARVSVFVNPRNHGAPALLQTALPAECEWRSFSNLADLLDQYMELTAWYGTDTGLYHLAAAAGIPATVFFGPTQPHKIIMAAEPRTTWARLAVLGDTHCEQKACTRPCCLHQAVADFCAVPGPTRVDETPADCPLRAHDPARLAELHVHRPA